MAVPEPVSVFPPALPRPRLLKQRWCDVAFLHWAVAPRAVARFLPPGVRPDTFDGRTYVGLVPFRMVGTRLGVGPSLPGVGTFLETNVRLYSIDETGRRGIVFLSLDANRALMVTAARTVFGLPYRWARMSFAAQEDDRRYAARVRWPGCRATSRIAVRAGGPAVDGPRERFLTARWGLHLARFGRTWYVPTAHPPWPLRTAELLTLDDGLLGAAGLGDLAGREPDHVAFSDGVAVEFAMPRPATKSRP